MGSLVPELGLEVITSDKANKTANKILSFLITQLQSTIDRTRLHRLCSLRQTVDLVSEKKQPVIGWISGFFTE